MVHQTFSSVSDFVRYCVRYRAYQVSVINQQASTLSDMWTSYGYHTLFVFPSSNTQFPGALIIDVPFGDKNNAIWIGKVDHSYIVTWSQLL